MNKYQFPQGELAHIEESELTFAIYQFLDKRVVTLALTEGFLKLFGYDNREQAYYDMDNDMYKNTHVDDKARVADAAYRFATEGGQYDVIYRTKAAVGPDEYYIIHAHGEHVITETGERIAQVIYMNEGPAGGGTDGPEGKWNETLRRALHEEAFVRSSSYDHLTGLPGMTYFFELASSRLSSLKEGDGNLSLMFMDFAGMKYYNHKYGFAQGDVLLRGFSGLLAQIYGNENCCRIGQDHFAAVCETQELEASLEKLFEETKKINDGRSLPVHVGIYQNWQDTVVPSVACDMAKSACALVKSKNSSEYAYYSPKMKIAEDNRQYIIANIDRAIRENWVVAYYQPIIRSVNGRVCNEEALARWIDPEKGFMSPADFIPVLEETGLIYKLDLHIVDCVLEKLRIQKEANLHLVPQSVNLSRSDFDSCDMVEEICSRVDAAGIPRKLIIIEITESIVGRDLEFIKSRTDRFRELGFSVWMDDFGSGYSSLDVLQDIQFDLIKFDMHFMRQLETNERSKIILTELLRMATSLGLETICEGVETEEQVQFLRDVGCTKLQGYYFEKPIPLEGILKKYEEGRQIGFENPDERPYFTAVGRLNLHDMTIIAQDNPGDFKSYFNTLPMAVIEVCGVNVRFTRSNRSYRDFMQRYFNFTIDDAPEPFYGRPDAMASVFMKTLLKTADTAGTLYVDENLPNGTTVHSCMRRVAVNEISGTFATVVVVLSISTGDLSITYANIAKALAADYFDLFYVDLETETFYEYSSKRGSEDIAMERRDTNFFSKARHDAVKYLHPDDAGDFAAIFTKENVVRDLNEHGMFTVYYRLMLNGIPVYVNMKAVRTEDDPRHIIIGVSNVDSKLKQKKMVEKINRTHSVFSRILALSSEYYSIYWVDPDTGAYTEYSANRTYRSFELPQQGEDIFSEAIEENYKNVIAQEDWESFRSSFNRENVLDGIHRNDIYTLQYRIIVDGKVVPVTLRATLVNDEDGAQKLLMGVCRRKEQ